MERLPGRKASGMLQVSFSSVFLLHSDAHVSAVSAGPPDKADVFF